MMAGCVLTEITKFLKNHIIILFGLVTVICMWLIQSKIHYRYFPTNSTIAIVWIALGLYAIGNILKQNPSKKYVNLRQLSVYLCIWGAFILLIRLYSYHAATDLPLVPYPLIDPYLYHFDEAFGFNVADVMLYTKAHFPDVSGFFDYIYLILPSASIFTLVVLPLVNWRSFERVAFLFFMLMAMTLVFCYFFPSIGPVYSYTHIQFPAPVEALKNAYLHLRNNPSLKPVSACVSCPSWHVLGSLLILMGWWPVKRFGIRYFVLAFCSLLVLSVFITGWHYLADAVGSVVFMIIAMFAARKALGAMPCYDFTVSKLVLKLLGRLGKRSPQLA